MKQKVILNELSLHHFKNHSSGLFSFHSGLNWLTGANGTGKTNVLDAIHYLSLGRSYFSSGDTTSISFNRNFFRIEGKFQKQNEDLHVVCRLRQGEKKELICNEVPYKKMSGHVGKLPVVMIEPDDHSIVDGISEERRKLIDAALSQIHFPYLESLLSYQKVLQQRNSYLKQFQVSRIWNEDLVASWDEQLQAFGGFIFSERKKLIKNLEPVIHSIYSSLCDQEEIAIEYRSDLNEHELAVLLKQSRTDDQQSGRTTAGIHTDDFDFLLNGRPAKKFASQGQRKSWLLALKLSLWVIMKAESGIPPILLLDDVFDKLDMQRSANLLTWIALQNIQCIFTEANPEKVRQLMSFTEAGHHIIFMEKSNAHLLIPELNTNPLA